MKESELTDEAIFVLDTTKNEALNSERVLSIYKESLGSQERLTKISKQDEEWILRMKCVQDWFIRCSWINKFLFLETLCNSARNVLVLEGVLKCIEPIFTKDLIESLSSHFSNYDKIPLDDNRTLNIAELKEAMNSDYFWFVNLETSYQIRVILRLMKLGGSGLIFETYQLVNRIFKEKQFNTKLLSTVPSVRVKSGLGLEENYRSQSLIAKSEEEKINAENSFTNAKLNQLARREAELSKFEKLKGISADEGKTTKKGEIKETTDYLQSLPINLNRRIMFYIDDKNLAGLKKVGKYWGKMIDEYIMEKSERKAINAKINKIYGTKPDKEEKTKENNLNLEFEFINELGRQAMINKKKESEKTLVDSTELYETIFSKKFKLLSIDTSYHSERCGAIDKNLGIFGILASNNMIHFYSIKTGAQLNFSVYGFESAITCLALYGEREFIFVGCKDGSVTAKNIKTNKNQKSFSCFTKSVIAIFTTASNLLAASLDNIVKYFQLWSGICLMCIDISFDGNISSLLLRNDKPFLTAIGTSEGLVILADIKNKKFQSKVKLHAEEITQMCHFGDILITGTKSGQIRVWDMDNLNDNLNLLMPFYNFTIESCIRSMVCYKNQIYAGCENGTLKIISLATGKVFKTMKISSQTPILGTAIIEDKVSAKLIIWHEGGIEMRIFSLLKLSQCKKSMVKNNRESKQKAPKETNQNKISKMASNGYVRKSQRVIEITPNDSKRTAFLRIKKPLKNTCLTLFTSKSQSKKICRSRTDVFTKCLNDELSASGNDFFLKTFSCCENLIPDKK